MEEKSDPAMGNNSASFLDSFRETNKVIGEYANLNGIGPDKKFIERFNEIVNKWWAERQNEQPVLFVGERKFKMDRFDGFNESCIGAAVCENCLSIECDKVALTSHLLRCNRKHPPGKIVYLKDDISVFCVNGSLAPQYCRSLCLIGQCFIKDKTVAYEVESFEFFVLRKAQNFVGYFSRQIMERCENNISCIVILPDFRRMGFGYFLVDLSYKILKMGEQATPERPFSPSGFALFAKYWEIQISKFLHSVKGTQVTLREIASATKISNKDLISTVKKTRSIGMSGSRWISPPRDMSKTISGAMECDPNYMIRDEPKLN